MNDDHKKFVVMTGTILRADGTIKGSMAMSVSNSNLVLGADITKGTARNFVRQVLTEFTLGENETIMITYGGICTTCGESMFIRELDSFVALKLPDEDDLWCETLKYRVKFEATLLEKYPTLPSKEDQLLILIQILREAVGPATIIYAEDPLDIYAIQAELALRENFIALAYEAEAKEQMARSRDQLDQIFAPGGQNKRQANGKFTEEFAHVYMEVKPELKKIL